ncbi:MAG: glycosyltransferase [Lachnospiraceae bacterium]|nr:glycosyltransferase [Lachnospiraceae bacterium]
MLYSSFDHTFVICAYKESPFLPLCIDSLLNQSIKSNIIISTSTPNSYIKNIASQYNLPLFINTGRKSIADDWNFGYSQAKTSLITIAHQDDIYLPTYFEEILKAVNSSSHPLILFTNYNELRNEQVSSPNFLVRYKRIMLAPLSISFFQHSKWLRRRILSFGCSICCPSVTYVKPFLPFPLFKYGFKSNLDWQTWETLSSLSGDFIYLSTSLIYHRIHADSETSNVIKSNIRSKEDYALFKKFWPSPVAKLFTKIYALSEKSNK